ncbi:MAG: DUF4389 domain-containing protein [Proteobacteria bacterium]|nr:DUF4389 domain-containing protein [Pseudomonadota bacterium]
MSEKFEDIVDHLRQPAAWIRVVFMLAFAVFLYLVIAPVILVLMVVQALFAVITGEENENLRFLGSALTVYVSQILEFVTYNSETKPFPFSDFPRAGEQAEAQAPARNDAADREDEQLTAAPAPKKKAAKKAMSKKTSKKSASKSSPR